MANDWFDFKGDRCTAYGIRCVGLPPVTLAEERVKFEDVAGRSGSLAMLEGEDVYEDITFSCDCIMTDPTNIAAAASWLRGAGRVTFANRPGGWHEARVINQIEFPRIIAANPARRFTVQFRAQPFFYLANVQDIEITAETAQIVNPGNVFSAPLIKVYGYGDLGIELAGQLVTLQDLDGGIALDTQLQDAMSLDGSQLMNGHMTGDFIRIPAGTSTIRWFSDDDNSGGQLDRIVIEPRWRCR